MQKNENDSIVITTNLPEQCEIFIKDNKSKYSQKMAVSNGTIEIKNATDISKVIINSGVFTADVNTQQIIGENCRNLVGKIYKISSDIRKSNSLYFRVLILVFYIAERFSF